MLRIVILLILLAVNVQAFDMETALKVLASDQLQGRGNGTKSALVAADSIAYWMDNQNIELVPGMENRFQDFPLHGEGFLNLQGRNVLGWIPGSGDLADEIVLIGAHYDHLGLAYNDNNEVSGIYNGAEDNASGVVSVLQIIGNLTNLKSPHRSLLVVLFAGEEIGLLGSSYLASNPVVDGKIVAMINIDSIGRLRNHRLYVGGLGSCARFRTMLTGLDSAGSFDLQLSDGGWDASDHVSFNAIEIPVLFFFTGPHPQYHSTEDTADLIEYQGLANVSKLVEQMTTLLLTDNENFDYQRNSDLKSVAHTGKGKKRAWLGTIPDFVEGVGGVKLSGVMPGSPADESGLARGDVLTKFDGEIIANLRDLTRVLQQHSEGEMVEVVVIREEQEKSFNITLRKRPN
ncbi:MAG: M28 family peptidase [bacterium]|nr:M28 family peptidase [bacterium]